MVENMKIKILLILATILCTSFFVFHVNVCLAISSGGLGIYPNKSEWNLKNGASKSWFVYDLNPGEIKNSKVDIKNDSDQSVTLKIYPVDAVTTKDGSFAPQSEDSVKKGVGSWINMSTTEISLNPNEVKTVDFVINVPTSAEIGDHMGAIIVQNKKLSGSEIGTAVQVINRLGARIYITVIGEKIEKLEITNFDKTIENGKVVFQLNLVNEGNTRITPKGEIEIKDKNGIVVDKIELTQREIFPKDTIVLPTKWEGTVNGNFNVLATVEYNNQKITKELVLNTDESKNIENVGNQILGVSDTRKKVSDLLIMGIIVALIITLTVVYRIL